MANDANNADQAMAAAVTLKLPAFWTKQPQVWFAQAEAQFALRNITGDDTKFHYVVASLDQDTAAGILALIRNPPAADKYKALKDSLEGRYSLSEYERINRIIDMPALGDEKPSALMNSMLSLLDSEEPNAFVRCLFLRRLPEEIRCVLVHSKEEDNRALARAADQLMEAKQASTVCTTTRPTADPVRRRTANSDGGICFYHRRFGTKAQKCIPPCSFPNRGNETAGRQ